MRADKTDRFRVGDVVINSRQIAMLVVSLDHLCVSIVYLDMPEIGNVWFSSEHVNFVIDREGATHLTTSEVA